MSIRNYFLTRHKNFYKLCLYKKSYTKATISINNSSLFTNIPIKQTSFYPLPCFFVSHKAFFLYIHNRPTSDMEKNLYRHNSPLHIKIHPHLPIFCVYVNKVFIETQSLLHLQKTCNTLCLCKKNLYIDKITPTYVPCTYKNSLCPHKITGAIYFQTAPCKIKYHI